MNVWMKYAVSWALGCSTAVADYLLVRREFSPWASVDGGKIIMLSSDHCGTSQKALRLIQSDPELSALIIPVPADGVDVDQPRTCAAALAAIGASQRHVRWLPPTLACKWLKEDVADALDDALVPTPSWYVAGELVTYQDEARERELFREYGSAIEWTAKGLRLSSLNGDMISTEPVDAKITAIFTTKYKRTRDTAQPLAKAAGVTAVAIDPKDEAGLIDKVKAAAGNVLIVGHSNTVPEAIKALGVTEPVAIADDRFDDLFVVIRGARPVLLRLHYR